MNVLVACEESQVVSTAFRAMGDNAFSCDIQPCSGGHPEYHYQGDCFDIAYGDCNFVAQDGSSHYIDSWDLVIAHPPCTYLSTVGNRYFINNPDRYIKSCAAESFFYHFFSLPVHHLCIENPSGYINSSFPPSQIIYPYYFGDPVSKRTCLWLRGLNKLVPTNIVEPTFITLKNGKSVSPLFSFDVLRLSPGERSRVRSRTFPGIASAMAQQWHDCLSFNEQLNLGGF